MSGSSQAIDESYAACRCMSRRAGSSFYRCFWLLPPEKRRAMDALYAFLRHTDDLGDEPGPIESRRRSLTRWRTSLVSALAGDTAIAGDSAIAGVSQHCPLSNGDERLGLALLPALAHTVRQFHVPADALHAVIDGVESDLDVCRYETFAELEAYCHRVASAVGMACIHIWGFSGPEAFVPARQCGVAYQLTNILRDLREDALAGRVYLPLEDLRRYDYRVEDLLAGVVDHRWHALVDFQIERARRFYKEGAALRAFLTPDGRRVFGMMTATYRLLLEEIARRKTEVFARRIRLSHWQKLRIAARWVLSAP